MAFAFLLNCKWVATCTECDMQRIIAMCTLRTPLGIESYMCPVRHPLPLLVDDYKTRSRHPENQCGLHKADSKLDAQPHDLMLASTIIAFYTSNASVNYLPHVANSTLSESCSTNCVCHQSWLATCLEFDSHRAIAIKA